MADDYGEIKVFQIDSGDEFWILIGEICDDKSNFIHNKSTIVDAYKNGHLYGLCVIETDQMYKRGAQKDTVFCDGGLYMLPCFCIKENDDTAMIIWVHSRARMKGYGKKLVQLLNIKKACPVLEESIGFWEKMSVQFKLKK